MTLRWRHCCLLYTSVLDEASSFADPENEAKIQKAFEALMKGKTVLMIALSLIHI